MKRIELAYGTGTIGVDIPSKNLVAVLELPPSHQKIELSEIEIIKKSLASPIDTAPLHILAHNKKKVVIITSDHTRAVPSSITMPLLLEEVRKGNPQADITILIATGLHRGMTNEEKVAKFGLDIFTNERLINHNAFDKNAFTDLGTLPSGSKCEINTLAIECDLLISEGFIEPHFFAGFSGGRKSVLPGVASQDCVNINHSASAIKHPLSVTGILDGNIIHEDMIQAARLANLSFILNVLLDENKKVIEAYCGDVDQAHRTGAESLMRRCGIDKVSADIVITTNGGYPLDQNLYQCPKGLDAALSCVKEEGVIILAASCIDGLGGDNFGDLMLSAPSKELLQRILSTPPEQTISEQWCAQRFSDALLKYSIILVTDGLDRSQVERMNFIYTETIKDAVTKALELKGKNASIAVIPDGVGIIIRREEK